MKIKLKREKRNKGMATFSYFQATVSLLLGRPLVIFSSLLRYFESLGFRALWGVLTLKSGANKSALVQWCATF